MRTLVRPRNESFSPGTWKKLAPLATNIEQRWPDLPVPVARSWSDHAVVTLERGRLWLYGPVDRDPLMSHPGSVTLPRHPRRQLRAMAAGGLRFPALVIAHELDPGGPARSLFPLLQDGPRTCTDEVARALVGPAPAHPGLTRVARLIARIVGGPPAAREGLFLSSLLDPIVFGVVAPGPLVHGAPSLWYSLVA